LTNDERVFASDQLSDIGKFQLKYRVQMTDQEFLKNHAVPIANRLHDWAITNDGVHVVYACDEKTAKSFIKFYLKQYPGCKESEVGLMLGSAKQSRAEQNNVFDLITQGTITLLEATCMLALGANIFRIISLQMLSNPYDGITIEQLLNRVMRGRSRAGLGIVLIMVSVKDFDSDFTDVRHNSLQIYATDISRKRLMRDILLSDCCQHLILDKYNPPLQIDGVLSESPSEPFTCGNMCLSCQFGIDRNVDVSRDGWIILLAVKETLGYLPAKVLAALLKGGKLAFNRIGELFKVLPKNLYAVES
jgi:hypothetical protein